MNEVPFDAAISQCLESVLHGLLMQRVINDPTAHWLRQNRNTWQNVFLSTLGQQQISQMDFERILSTFLYQNAARLTGQYVQQQYPQQYSQPGYSYQQSYQQPIQQGPQYGGYPAPTTNYPMQYSNNMQPLVPLATHGAYGTEPTHQAAQMINDLKAQTKTVKPEPQCVTTTLPEGYEPVWVTDSRLVEIISGGDSNTITERRLPKNDYEAGLSTVGVGNEDSLLGDVYDCSAIIRRYFGTNNICKLVARVTTREALIIRKGDKHSIGELTGEFRKYQKMVINGSPADTVLDELMSKLETQPQHVYSAISKLIVNLFNEHLNSYRLMADTNVRGVSVSIKTLDGVKSFNPVSSVIDANVEVLKSQPGYGRAFQRVAKSIIDTLAKLRVATSIQELKLAPKYISGSTGYILRELLDIGAEGVVEEVNNYGVVLTYPVSYLFTNLALHEIGCARSLVADGKDFSRVVRARSGNFDYAVSRMADTESICVRDLVTCEPMLYLGRSIEENTTVRLVTTK